MLFYSHSYLFMNALHETHTLSLYMIEKLDATFHTLGLTYPQHAVQRLIEAIA